MERKRSNLNRYTVGGGSGMGTYRINDDKKKRKKRLVRRLWFLVILAVIAGVGIYILFHTVANTGRSTIGKVTRIGATITQNVTPFGDKVIFYDGTTIHCVGASGGNEWSYQIGANADFDATDERIVAWSGNDLYILNSRGRLIYNNRMVDTIQFASAGNEYAAAFVGSADTGVIIVINSNGQIVDNISIENQTLLDIGFFTASTTSSTQTTELMWVLGLNTSGTVISTELQTYQPGRLLTGKSSLGEHIAYKIYDINGILNVVTTREIYHYTYRIIENDTSTLIYGYTMEDVQKIGNTVYQLFVPASEQSGSATIKNVRIMYGNIDRMLHLPGRCITAKLGTRCIYGFAENTIYACRYGDTTFEGYPVNINITAVLGMISDNRAVVASGSDIYIIELPL